MKRLQVVGPAVLALAVAAAGCSRDREPSRTDLGNPPATQQTTDRRPAEQSESARWVNDMMLGGMTEVELGKLVDQHAASAAVKSFGQMMVKDHSQANQELTPIALQLNLEQPLQLDSKHQDVVDKLSKQNGRDFDKDFMKQMVDDHEEVLDKLKERFGDKTASTKAATETTATRTSGTTIQTGSALDDLKVEQSINDWAAKVMPKVQEHLDKAKQLQKTVERAK